MKIVKQNTTKNGYELETEQGYVIDAKLSFGELTNHWILTAEWGESHISEPLKVGTLGNIVDPIESTLELIKTVNKFDVEFDPTMLDH